MFKQGFDIVGYLHERITEFEALRGIKPQTLVLSPPTFMWLVSVFSEEQKFYGVTPIDMKSWTYTAGMTSVHIIIDEMAEDFQAKIL